MVCNEGTAVRLRNQIVSKVVNLFTLETKINCLLLVFTIKEGKSGTSLVVQWLRLHAPNAGGLGLIPVLAQASPIFHSSCEGKLGIALE